MKFPYTPGIDPRRACIPRPQGFDATDMLGYELPLEDPAYAEVWFYTDRLSYRPGDVVRFHISRNREELPSSDPARRRPPAGGRTGR